MWSFAYDEIQTPMLSYYGRNLDPRVLKNKRNILILTINLWSNLGDQGTLLTGDDE